MDVRAVNRALRAAVWPRLREEGFATTTTRAGWRYWDRGVEVIDVQSVGAAWDAVGCTSYSFGAHLGSWPAFLPASRPAPTGVDGRPRPHYWDCPLSITLNKTIAQPWFQPFAGPSRPLSPPAAKHREGLRQVLRTDVHDRRDLWYVLEDGSNLEEVIADLVRVAMLALPDVMSVRDPCVTASRLERGEWGVRASSPRGTELIRAANTACLGQT